MNAVFGSGAGKLNVPSENVKAGLAGAGRGRIAVRPAPLPCGGPRDSGVSTGLLWSAKAVVDAKGQTKKAKIFIILSLIISMPLFSQIDDLSMFGIDGSALDRVSSDSDMDLSSKRETEPPRKEPIDKDKYKDYGYGYTGGISFINPPQKKLPDEPLEYFGYNYFSDEKGAFSPLMNVPVSPDYLIGPDDIIKIILILNVLQREKG